MSEVSYAPAARTDLEEIATFIALDSERQAERVLALIVEKAAQAARRPLIYRLRGDPERGFHAARVYRYLIVFRIIDSGIEVVRVVHDARDLKDLFGGIS